MIKNQKSPLDECLNTETILQDLTNDSANLELWQKLKLLTFGKSVCLVICGTLVNFLVKIQLSILNGYNYQSITNNNNKFVLTPKMQEKYLSLCQLFVSNQIGKWTEETLLPIIETHIGPLELNKKLRLGTFIKGSLRIYRSMDWSQRKNMIILHSMLGLS